MKDPELMELALTAIVEALDVPRDRLGRLETNPAQC